MSIWVGYTQEGLSVKEKDVVYYDVRQTPFQIYGLWNPQINFHRMPDDVAKEVSDAVATHSKAAAGGRVRFSTDSPYIAIRIKHAPFNCGAPGISRQGQTGVDMYLEKNGKDVYYGSFLSPVDMEEEYEGILHIEEEGMHHITLCMPYIKEVFEMEVGIKEGSSLIEHQPYRYETPVVFYGSSITQGVSASRPGNTYENFISRRLDCNYVDLGIAGNAMGEQRMAEYISELSMKVFVMDYDHNAPDVEHLQKTHKPFLTLLERRILHYRLFLLQDLMLGMRKRTGRDVK